MFGYIKVYKEELKICEYEVYRAIYGSLCNQLQKDFGLLARFSLNYDAAFLAMLRMSVLGSSVSAKQARCPLNPLVKCNRLSGDTDALRFAASVSVMLTYHKCKDNLSDEGALKRIPALLALPFVGGWYKKACCMFPDVGKMVTAYMVQQSNEEKLSHSSFDRYCHPTATVLGQIFSFGITDETVRTSMEKIGYHIGKWVYMTDALDDYFEDCKRKRFNPIYSRLGQQTTPDELCLFVERQSNFCLDVACEAYDKLGCTTFSPIVRNVFILGLPQVLNEIIRKVKNHE